MKRKYGYRKFKGIGLASAVIGFTLLSAPVYAEASSPDGGGLVSSTETASTTPQPEGNVIARGEDGVPWELYENGYLLFKPVAGKDTLRKGTWKNYKDRITYIKFTGKTYAPEDSSNLFARFGALIYVDGANLDTSNVTNMYQMFQNATKLTTLDVSNWDTSNVTNMRFMFAAEPRREMSLTHLDVSRWKTGKVTDMSAIFQNVTKLTTLDVSNWDTSNVKYMNWMFCASTGKEMSLTHLDVSRWNTSKVTSMRTMFQNATKLTTLDVSNWDTSNVTDMSYMFCVDPGKEMSLTHLDVSSLTHLDVSHWNTSNVKSMIEMFKHATKLTTLDVSNWDMSKVTNMRDMFDHMPKLKELKLGDKFKADGIRTIQTTHGYGNLYTDKWHKVNDKSHPYTVSDWATAYATNSTSMAGTWVREEKVQDATLNFQGENFTPVKVTTSDTALPTLPRPSQPKQNHKFLGWSKDGRNPLTREEVKPGETITLQPLWQPVNNTTTRTEAIPVATTYRGDDKLDYGKRKETPGNPGEKRITTTYTVAPYTGEFTNPVEKTEIIRDMIPKVITIGTKPTVTKSNPVERTTRVNKDNTKPIGYNHVDTEGFDGYTETITHYDVDATTGNVTERTETRTVPPVERVVTEGTLTYDLPTTGTADMTITLAGLVGTLVITKRKKTSE